MKKIILIGAGASNLMAAAWLCKKYKVLIYDKQKSIGRKLLVAGHGGFNLTNDMKTPQFLAQYTANNDNVSFLKNALTSFNNHDLRKWLADLNIPTFVGSSGRVFPQKGIKPIHVLQNIKQFLIDNKVQFFLQHEFVGFSSHQHPIFKYQEEEIMPTADFYFFGLGGASWSVTGANPYWLPFFQKINIKTQPFQASNCGLNVNWNIDFKNKYEGTPLKNIAVHTPHKTQKGEALITKYGLEGNAIYPIIPSVRPLLNNHQKAVIYLDFKPHNTLKELLTKIENKNIQTKNYKYFFKLQKVQVDLLKKNTSKEEYLNVKNFVKKIKKCPIQIHSLRPLDEAISTVGGIDLSEVTPFFLRFVNIRIFIVSAKCWTGTLLLVAFYYKVVLLLE